MAIVIHLLLQAAFIVRALLRPHRDPASRAAWVLVILMVPVFGMLLYLFLGETSIGRRRLAALRRADALLPRPEAAEGYGAPENAPQAPDRYAPLFAVGRSISGFEPVGGNHAELMADSNAAIDRIVADIDAAQSHVHIAFYIWLTDGNGEKVAQAIMRAAGRGVACRVMVDDLGSRAFVRSDLWREMKAAGAACAQALPLGPIPILHALRGRIDLRDHRKIVVIDNRIVFVGSQNCADPEFRVKAKYAPWVDVMMRMTGPIVAQNQRLFAVAWMQNAGEDLAATIEAPIATPEAGFTAQVIATGPTGRFSAMPEMFASLAYQARRELTITTPYYAPTAAMQSALEAAANRGVSVTLILPARNDDFAVAAASRSLYLGLLRAGVRIFEYGAGLLHAKTLTLDGEVCLIGSANMDRRSFDLNYENNVLIMDAAVTQTLQARQGAYLADSREITTNEVEAWSIGRRLWNNTLAVVSPLV